MLFKPAKFFLALAITGVICSTPLVQRATAQAAPQTKKEFKDKDEFDLYEAIRTGKDPAANIAKLDEWKKKYAETQFGSERLAMYLTNYAAQNKTQDVVNTSKEILGTDPNNFTALYYMTLYTQARVPQGAAVAPADVLAEGEKSANGVLANLDKQKPANMADGQWDTSKKPIVALAQTNLGWIAMQRKQYDVAENAFKQSLAANPNNGLVDYWLGLVQAYEKNTAKGPELLFFFARAATYTGEGAAPAGIQTAASSYLDKAYVGYHGSKDGLDKVKEAAKANAMPPPGWTIESVTEIGKKQQAKEDEDAKSNPQLATWKNLKTTLTSAEGAAYFSSSMKDALLPTLRGKVVKLTPETNPKSIVLSCIDGTTPDATLNFEAALPGKVEPGTELTFEGVAESFTAEPFMVNFKVEKDKVHGWTGKGAARPAPVRRPGAGKKR